ncbi:MAG: GNAT family N-acetyltransferase [Paraglaciecola sp.]|nr:GNAT family N-acetyltransferase [Paraglaciecola sp.]
MQIDIRQATLKDMTQLSALFDQYRVFYQQQSDLKLAQEFLTTRIEKAESIIFVAETQQQILLGFSQLYPSFSSVSAKRTWQLNDLYVQAEYQNLGIGTQLLNQVKAYAKHTGAKGVFLQTAKTNTGAQKLYQSLGYQAQDYLGYFLTV